jgi:hypothetical protein
MIIAKDYIGGSMVNGIGSFGRDLEPSLPVDVVPNRSPPGENNVTVALGTTAPVASLTMPMTSLRLPVV